jgi:hypothetical protein
MCCLTAVFVVFGSRVTLLVWWFLDSARFNLAFSHFPHLGGYTILAWAWTLLGGIVLPWTTLAYLIVFPGGIVGYEWIVLLIGLLVDLAGHGSGYHYRDRVPYFRRN